MAEPGTVAFNPYAVTTLEMSPPPLDGAPVLPRWLTLLLTVLGLLLILGAGAAMFHIETILVSGPILFVIGLVLVFVRRARRSSAVRMISWGCLAFPLTCLLLINLNQWGPSDAHLPVSTLCLFYSLVNAIVIVYVLRSTKSRLALSSSLHASSSGPLQTEPDVPADRS